MRNLQRKQDACYLLSASCYLKYRVRNFQEGFLSLPLSNLPYPELSLSMPSHSSLKYCDISETTENHAQDKELHSAVYQFLFLKFLVLSYSKYTMKQAKRQGEESKQDTCYLLVANCYLNSGGYLGITNNSDFSFCRSCDMPDNLFKLACDIIAIRYFSALLAYAGRHLFNHNNATAHIGSKTGECLFYCSFTHKTTLHNILNIHHIRKHTMKQAIMQGVKINEEFNHRAHREHGGRKQSLQTTTLCPLCPLWLIKKGERMRDEE